MQQYGTLHLAW